MWLDVPFEAILERLSAAGRSRRPLLQDEVQARMLHERRSGFYAEADHRIRLTGSEVAVDVARRIASQLRSDVCAI